MGDAELRDVMDERDWMTVALHLMRDTFLAALEAGGRGQISYDEQGRFQGQFFDGYADAKKIWGKALLKRDTIGKRQELIDNDAEDRFRQDAPTLASLPAPARKLLMQFMVLHDATQVLRETGPPGAEKAAMYLDGVAMALCLRAGFPPEMVQAMIDNRPPIEYGEQ